MKIDDKYNPISLLFSLFHLSKNNVFRKLKLYLIMMVIYAAVVTSLNNVFTFIHEDNKIGQFHLLFSFCLTIIIGFRINVAYARWWEARGHWGGLVNNIRALTIKANAYIDLNTDIELKTYILKFAEVFKYHLHRDVSGGRKVLIENNMIVGSEYNNLPLFLINQITQKINYYRKENKITFEQFLSLNEHITEITNVVGACEKILNTLPPEELGIFTRFALLFYIIVFPLGWVSSFEFLVIPILIVLIYVLLGLEVIAEEIERPFGFDHNCLPLQDYVKVIEKSITEITQKQ